MDNNEKLIGFFIKICFNDKLKTSDFNNLSNEFTPYIFRNHGICNYFNNINFKKYGIDIVLILFEFLVMPSEEELSKVKKIGAYRSREKSIGIPIIVTDENFFSKSEEERYNFLKQSIFQKLELLEEVVKKKKLDTKMDLLKADLHKILS